MHRPTSLYNAMAVAARYRSLPRSKQWMLAALAALGLLLVVAAVLYAVEPDSTAALGTGSAAQPTSTALTPASTPTIAGQFVLQNGPQSQVVLILRQYGAALTGTYTIQGCLKGQMHTSQRVVTGQLLPDGSLQLTFTSADSPHSSTGHYLLVTTDTGFLLHWQDHTGRTNSQQWQHVADNSTTTLSCSP